MHSYDKLSTYNDFKSAFIVEPYVLNMIDFKKRSLVANFRCSGHRLEVEVGRYDNIDRRERFCKLCTTSQVEDEFHFLAVCSRYSILRQKYLPSLYCRPTYDNFIFHMQKRDLTNYIANFISHAMNVRRRVLDQ